MQLKDFVMKVLIDLDGIKTDVLHFTVYTDGYFRVGHGDIKLEFDVDVSKKKGE